MNRDPNVVFRLQVSYVSKAVVNIPQYTDLKDLRSNNQALMVEVLRAQELHRIVMTDYSAFVRSVQSAAQGRQSNQWLPQSAHGPSFTLAGVRDPLLASSTPPKVSVSKGALHNGHFHTRIGSSDVRETSLGIHLGAVNGGRLSTAPGELGLRKTADKTSQRPGTHSGSRSRVQGSPSSSRSLSGQRRAVSGTGGDLDQGSTAWTSPKPKKSIAQLGVASVNLHGSKSASSLAFGGTGDDKGTNGRASSPALTPLSGQYSLGERIDSINAETPRKLHLPMLNPGQQRMDTANMSLNASVTGSDSGQLSDSELSFSAATGTIFGASAKDFLSLAIQQFPPK